MKRVSTREFLRNINSMTEPVEVYSRSQLKGTWLPNTTWSTDMSNISHLITPTLGVPNSDPAVVGADAEQEIKRQIKQ